MVKKRILFIIPLPPPVHGSAMMNQYIKESKLINGAFDCDFVNLSTSRRMDEIGKKPLLKMVRFVWAYCLVLGKLMHRRYDLCYLAITCHGIVFLKDAPFVLLCKLFGKKIVIHQHNKGMSRDVKQWPYRWLLPLVYRNTKVILLSWRLYPDIENVVRKEQILICPNGIPEETHRMKITSHTIACILFLSNLLIDKGVLTLLDACEILKVKGEKFMCRFVGGETKDIDSRMFAEETKKRRIDDCVFYVGRKYGKEKAEAFCDADIFVQPTFDDCFPLTVLEAMQYKLPIVATSQGAIAEMVEHGKTGLICQTKDAADLAKKLKVLLDNPQLRLQYGEAGYERFKFRYTLDRFERCMVSCLSFCVNE